MFPAKVKKNPQTERKLTAVALKSLDGESVTLVDTTCPGLMAIGGKRGATFYLQKRVDGKPRKIKIGKYPYMALETARIRARAIIADVERGQTAWKSSIPTVGEAIDAYIEEMRTERTRTGTKSFLGVWNAWRECRADSMPVAAVRDFHRQKGQTAPIRANRCVKYLVTALRKACRRAGIAFRNPAEGLILYEERPRDRYMDQEEVRRFLDAIHALAQDGRNRIQAEAILMMLYTGARKTNVLEMRFDEISKDGIWTIPQRKFKGGKNSCQIMLGELERMKFASCH